MKERKRESEKNRSNLPFQVPLDWTWTLQHLSNLLEANKERVFVDGEFFLYMLLLEEEWKKNSTTYNKKKKYPNREKGRKSSLIEEEEKIIIEENWKLSLPSLVLLSQKGEIFF